MCIYLANIAALPAAQAPSFTDNPLLREWNTPFGMPPFSEIRAEHFLPAFERAIAERRREVEAIIANPEPPTFANTIEALDAAGLLLERVQMVFSNLTSAETNDQLQQVERQAAPMLAAARDDILLNIKLFERVRAVWDERKRLKLSKVQQRLLEDTYKTFLRGGANLDAKQKERLRAINGELSKLTVEFGNNLLRETNSFRLVVSDRADLAGLPENLVAAAAEAARQAGEPGKWVFTLHAPSLWPFLTYSENRELRRRMLEAYLARCDRGNEFDNKKILARIAALRAERAQLIGYRTHAHFVLEENMAKNPERVYEFLDRLWKPTSAVARKEAEALQALIREEGGDFKLEAWDWRYYAEKLKRARYDIDENRLRPYFPLEQVRQGAFEVARRLYGLRFVERKDLPKYHPEVLTFEVLDADGSHLGVFLADYHPRPGKRSGAWSSRYRGQYFKDGKEVRPIVVNVCNFTRPSGGQPALLSPEEVETLFHEFGHALHSLLARVPYRSLASTPRDFVELPSQIMENWAMEPEVLAIYARHYATGEPIPQELVRKLKESEKFNQGFATMEYLAASFLDMDWHTLAPGREVDPAAFEKESLARISLLPEVGVRYRSTYF